MGFPEAFKMQAVRSWLIAPTR